ncbi:MAG TPA: PACE efflux transporter [Cellvibrio sp.]|nr:PACE efflux transporter [Cellvibrio sp.]
MNRKTRRIVQAVLYEFFAVVFVGPALSFIFAEPAGSAITLAIVMSAVALVWNYIFNSLFERWESRRPTKGRPLSYRLLHGLGFEGGLVVILVPLMACWLQISLLQALLADLGVLVFFFIYAIVFNWIFDAVFGLPESARN